MGFLALSQSAHRKSGGHSCVTFRRLSLLLKVKSIFWESPESFGFRTHLWFCVNLWLWKMENQGRGHPDLNRGPLDLQSNALPLSYTPSTGSILANAFYIHSRLFFFPWKFFFQNQFLLATRYWIVITRTTLKDLVKTWDFENMWTFVFSKFNSLSTIPSHLFTLRSQRRASCKTE